MERAAQPGAAVPPPVADDLHEVTKFWWVWLVTGIAWVVIALVILQFDDASIRTVGTLIGIMFLFSGMQQLGLAALAEGGLRWMLVIFGVLFLAAGVVSLIEPEDTFHGLADILGFLFLLVGTFWTIEALAQRHLNEFWLLGLMSGILMIILAFWTSGQFFIEKTYILLVFAGIWALMHGVKDITRAFMVRRL